MKRRADCYVDVSSTVLDLSKRRESFEVRSTPSPYSKNNDDTPSPQSPERDFNNSNHHYNIPERFAYAYGLPPANLVKAEFNQSLNQSSSPIRDSSVSPPQSLPASFLPFPPYLLPQQSKIKIPANKELQMMYEKNTTSSNNLPEKSSTAPPTSMHYSKHVRPFKLFSQTALHLSAYDNPKYELYKKEMIQKLSANPEIMSNSSGNNNNNSKIKRAPTKPDKEKYQALQDGGLSDSSSETVASSSSTAKQEDKVNNNDSSKSSNCEKKDPAYYERRRKNNEAAKKSRDRRRQKEDEIAIRVHYLEKENVELRVENAHLKQQLAVFHQLSQT